MFTSWSWITDPFGRASLSVPDQAIAFSKRGQHSGRQTFKPALPVGTFLPQYRLGIQS